MLLLTSGTSKLSIRLYLSAFSGLICTSDMLCLSDVVIPDPLHPVSPKQKLTSLLPLALHLVSVVFPTWICYMNSVYERINY